MSTTLAPAAVLRLALDHPDLAWPGLELRPHQLAALVDVAHQLDAGEERVWVDAPTGSGKTVTFLALAGVLGAAILVLVPRRTLVAQTLSSAARLFPQLTIAGEGPDVAGSDGLAVCTYQAALRDPDAIDWLALDGVICDEAHTALGAATRELLDRAWGIPVIGFTATPQTTTGHVSEVFGTLAASLDRAHAMDLGILAPLRSLRITRPVDLAAVPVVRGDFDPQALERAILAAGWHTALVDEWVERFAPHALAGVAYTGTVAAADALAREFRRRGVNAQAVSGRTTRRTLTRHLEAFGRGEIEVLCNADLLTEGWDEQRAAVCMHLAPTCSPRVYAQRIGRVLRPAPGKEAVSVDVLPPRPPADIQSAHATFHRAWYRPLGVLAGTPTGALREDTTGPIELVNPAAPADDIRAGLAEGWRQLDPAALPEAVFEDWVSVAAAHTDLCELIGRIDALTLDAARAWWAVSGLIERRLDPEQGQEITRAWATRLVTMGAPLVAALPPGSVRRVLWALRMTPAERLRALWGAADRTRHWRELAEVAQQLEEPGRFTPRWRALRAGGGWAGGWGWDLLMDLHSPEASHDIRERHLRTAERHVAVHRGELSLVTAWLREVNAPLPAPDRPEIRLPRTDLAEALALLGPGDVPTRMEDVPRLAVLAERCGGWAALRGALDAIDVTDPQLRSFIRRGVARRQPQALTLRRAWLALHERHPRLPALPI